MRNKIYLLLIIVLLLLVDVKAASNNNSKEIITGTYQYSAIEGNNKQNQNTFKYKDSDFTKSSFIGSQSLEILSIQVASASLSWYGEELDKYEIDSSHNDYNIKNFLEKMKFNNIESNKYYNLEKKENSVGVVIGQKNIIQDGKKYTLLAIIPRSAGYKQEWAGNFTIGADDIHEGFKSARDEILRFTKKYIEKNNIKGDLKIWTAGYSRGAAISNMVGGFFAGGGIEYFGNTVKITPEDVYCYTIGTPSSVKNGASKNIELSVSANRTGPDYVNDTEGEAFSYTKGGTVIVNDSVYNGVRNIISYDDAFSLLPPETWGFTRYGKVIESSEGLSSEEDMLKELKSISEYVYGAYTFDGKRIKFNEKTFDLKTLNIVDKGSNTSQIDFFKERLNGLVNKIGTNKIYNDEYQDALKSIIGTYGMVATLTGDISENSNLETTEMIYPLIYTYLAYVSDKLQEEGRASSETEAVTIVIEDVLKYFIGAEIDKETFTIDDFVQIVLKYVADNEEGPISNTVVSGIIGLVPDDYIELLPLILNGFTTKSNPTIEEALKAFIKACYYGPLAESSAYLSYETPADVRQLLYMTMVIAIGTDIPELQNLISGEGGRLDGHGKFEDFVDLMLTLTKQEKNEQGQVVKTYANMGQLADKELVDLLDNLLPIAINKSEELYGKEYRDDFEKQFNNMKQNITKEREIISALLFYTEDGYNVKESIENTITLIQNAYVIAMPHFDEIYLALARTSSRYDVEYECIYGDGQEYDLENEDELKFIFDIDFNLFNEKGKIIIDNIEQSRDKYTLSEGSTIVTFSDDYAKSLSKGDHTLLAQIDDKKVEVEFSITKSDEHEEEKLSDEKEENKNTSEDTNKDNPQTNDNILDWVYLSIISLCLLIGSIWYLKKFIN